MRKAVIFDLDGTLCNTVASIALTCNQVLQENGMQEREEEEYRFYAGDGVDELVRRALEADGVFDENLLKKSCLRYREIFPDYCTYQVKAYPDIEKTLDMLKEQGMKLGVLTNKPHEEAIYVLNQVFGTNYFDAVTGQKKGTPKKPDPNGALQLAEHFGVLPSECIYVGDTNVDMQTGNAAGMFTVGVTWGFRSREELIANHAHKLIDSPLELIKRNEDK